MAKTATCIECGEKHRNHKWVDGVSEQKLDDRCFNCRCLVSLMRDFESIAGRHPLIGKPRKLTIEKYKIERIKLHA